MQIFPLDELFRILYGIVLPGENIERGDGAKQMAEKAGQAAHRLEKPPIADQVHVVLWVIKADDIRFVNGQYMDKFNFVQQILNREGEFDVICINFFLVVSLILIHQDIFFFPIILLTVLACLCSIAHFTFVCLAIWPLSESEARG